MIIYNILIFTFGFWNIFKKHKSLSPVLGVAFMATLSFWAISLISCGASTQHKVLYGVGVMLGLSLLGFILISLSKNKLAQIGAVILSAAAINLYYSNPHTPIDSAIKLDDGGELLVRVSHENKEDVIAKIALITQVVEVRPLIEPHDENQTRLDDYVVVDVRKNVDLDEAVSAITAVDGVEWIEPSEVLTLDVRPSNSVEGKSDFANSVSDPMAKDQWNMQVLGMASYHKLFSSGAYQPARTAKLFILDSGVNASHEDIGMNFVRHPSLDIEANESDDNGHGTHCAGVSSGITNNGLGIASMSPGSAWVQVSSVRVMNRFGLGSQTRLIEGIIEAVDGGADVISMSLGSRSGQVEEQAYIDAMDYAADHNVIVIAAAGNNAGDASEIVPANHKSVIAVTALDRNLRKAQFSNHVANTTYGISAPGTSIVSTWKNGRYATFDGTSMAAPHVAGLAAVMRSIDPSLTTARLHKILDQTGTKTKDNDLTGKMINPTAAIKKMK